MGEIRNLLWRLLKATMNQWFVLWRSMKSLTSRSTRIIGILTVHVVITWPLINLNSRSLPRASTLPWNLGIVKRPRQSERGQLTYPSTSTENRPSADSIMCFTYLILVINCFLFHYLTRLAWKLLSNQGDLRSKKDLFYLRPVQWRETFIAWTLWLLKQPKHWSPSTWNSGTGVSDTFHLPLYLIWLTKILLRDLRYPIPV